MKKNLVFKLGLFCAALVLVATCFVTNAWAKYTKTVSATDSARVAKFAFTVKEGATTFVDNTEIDVFDTTFVNIYGANDSVDSEKLIAPGSSGSFVISMSNQSEVSLSYTLSATHDIAKVTVDAVEKEIPLVWKYDSNATEYTSLQACLAAATEANHKWVIDVDNLSEVKTVTIHWSWKTETDKIDTAFGEAAVANKLFYKVVVSCTATQVKPDGSDW